MAPRSNPLAALLLAIALSPAPSLMAQDAAAASAFSKEQLEQIVAPIALYPDSLVTQMLMASTYPLEIVEAARWSQQKSSLKGAELEAALKDQPWDPSVKSLCGFPDVLKRMNENLDWTRDMGDAFLGQQAETLDAVQRMRGKAYENGQLKTTEQQTVTQQSDKIIIIESSDPEVIYVPTYSPTVVYGAYPAPYYPAVYAPPGYGALAFTAGVMWGAAMWGNANWGWGNSDVNVNVNNYNNFNSNTNINANKTNIQNKSGNSQWNHSPEHRSGVNYKDGAASQKYGGQAAQTRGTQSQARGYGSTQSGARASGASQQPANTGSRTAGASPSTRDAGSAKQSGASSTRMSDSAASSRASGGAGGSGSSAWGGSSGGSSASRSASSRGSSSRSSGGGGGSRGGGGGGGGRR